MISTDSILNFRILLLVMIFFNFLKSNYCLSILSDHSITIVYQTFYWTVSGRRYKNAIRPPQNKNRIVPLYTKDDSSKGRILSDHRYLDASGNIRIRTQPKYLAQKGRGPTYIHRPPPGTVQHRRDQAAGDSRRNAAARGIPPQSARGTEN